MRWMSGFCASSVTQPCWLSPFFMHEVATSLNLVGVFGSGGVLNEPFLNIFDEFELLIVYA